MKIYENYIYKLDELKDVKIIWKKHDKACIIELGIEYPTAIVDIDRLKPIPLTEDIHKSLGVVKNGFGDYEYQINKNKLITFCGDYVYLRDLQVENKKSHYDDMCTLWNDDLRKRKMYLHEWQNLYFALTGTELEINL